MKYKKILLTGSTGLLGKAILGLKKNKKNLPFLTQARNILDITKPQTLKSFFKNNKIDAIIHCAALARMKECNENPMEAIETNIIGTANLVVEAINAEKRIGKNIRFIHISTDGVYQGTKGNYSENDATIPYNSYGWTKLGAECAVRLLKNHCIIRTSFFDPENIKFEESATDAYTSKVTVHYLAKAVITMLNSNFRGAINIGSERKSDYENYRKYKPSISPCKFSDISKKVQFQMAKDASMNISIWKKLDKQMRDTK